MVEPTDALAARTEEEHDPHYEPVIRLTEQVDTKTGEEEDDVIFKMRAKLFRFEASSSEWKERGTGDVRLLRNKESKKVRLVMRRDKTLKVCANHTITSDMQLQPNIGSDRSWVWKVAADYTENPPTAETLAIRFANSDNAGQFKAKFEEARESNANLHINPAPATVTEVDAPKAEGDADPEKPAAEKEEKDATEAEKAADAE